MDESKEKFYRRLIRNSIEEYRSRKIDLSRLVSDLEVTIESLHNISDKDATDLWDSWCILEMIYASELSRKSEDKSYSSLDDPEFMGILISEIEKIWKLSL